MTKMLISDTIILLLLTFSFQIANIFAIPCNNNTITHQLQNDTIQIIFLSTDIINLNRTVQCTANSSIESIHGYVYNCTGLGYGQSDQISIGIEHDNGTLETCFITYATNLQPPTLAYINVTGDRVRLGIEHPIGSFDYVIIYCSDEKTHIIFNTSAPLEYSIISVDCSFLLDMPLMSFVLETIKEDFTPAVTHVVQEVPLPVPFTYSFDSLLLTVIANSPPKINLPSIYEFNLIFHDKQNENITYERIKVSNFQLNPNFTFKYGLIPNLKHEIIFTHTINSIGYALSKSNTTPTSNVSYPYEVTNVRIQEDFNNIMLSWTDTHSEYDPIEFIVLCNSSENSMRKVNRNTTYTCQQTTFNEISIISIQTRVAIPGYTHDRIAAVEINVKQIPDIPLFDVFNKTETTIMIQWNYNNSFISNLFEYKIQCGSHDDFHLIDIQSNAYQCQSLEEATLFIITMSLVNINNTIQRLRSIQANTLLQKSKCRTHHYPPDINATRIVIIEWSPPNKNFEKIYVYCPSTYFVFDYHEVTSVMFVKCEVTSGRQYNVTFVTFKSGFEPAVLQCPDTAPIDSTTTTTTTSTTTTSTTTTSTTTTSTTTTSTTTTSTITTSTTTTPTTTTSTSTTTSSTTTTPTTTTSTTTTSTTTTPTTTTSTTTTSTTATSTTTTSTTTTSTITTSTTTTSTTTTSTTATSTTTTSTPNGNITSSTTTSTTTTSTPNGNITSSTTTSTPHGNITSSTTTSTPHGNITSSTTTSTTTTSETTSTTTTTSTPNGNITSSTTTSIPGTDTTDSTTTSTPGTDTTDSTMTTGPGATSTCSSDDLLKMRDDLLKMRDDLSRWRTAAIIAFIIAGFLLLATICLIIFSTLVVLRNRHSNTDD
ncbi:unnamed protein product [Rotaria sordida]|uniref:Uncharacterized protein n=1 Tax=Rotaria sordida TaxID=392033 RepID=A0A815GL67_9BILA|nr:unnamed protein product [Rotaria sordida]